MMLNSLRPRLLAGQHTGLLFSLNSRLGSFSFLHFTFHSCTAHVFNLGEGCLVFFYWMSMTLSCMALVGIFPVYFHNLDIYALAVL